MNKISHTEESLLPVHSGHGYTDVLSWIHQGLSPRSYLEVGTLSGATARLSQCPTICIDPAFQVTDGGVGSRLLTLFAQMTSDRFFADYDPSVILGRPIDFAFLDGLHEYETLLRDFINVERFCRPNSVVAIHDLYPTTLRMARREEVVGEAWTGDVWKLVPILKEERPDLDIIEVNAPPTGLLICTNLNPNSSHLSKNYAGIVKKWRSQTLQEHGIDTLFAHLRPTSDLDGVENLRKFFWL